ncbi:uncharacterized protein TNCV_3673091 [Trichonephila clavipes]|nr:uncharacterized protein TNCV_3673091 [Trichonephila clavipes]
MEKSQNDRNSRNNLPRGEIFRAHISPIERDVRFGTIACPYFSPDNAHSVAFSQRSNSPRLIEEEIFNDSDIRNNLIDYEDGQEEPDFSRVDINMQRSSFPTNWRNIFLK